MEMDWSKDESVGERVKGIEREGGKMDEERMEEGRKEEVGRREDGEKTR